MANATSVAFFGAMSGGSATLKTTRVQAKATVILIGECCVIEDPIEKLKALAYLEGRKFTSIAEVRSLLALLGNPQDKVRSIHVAGTNGKGSVCAMLSSMLISSGYNVGTALSPHLIDITERCLINGRPCERELFANAVERVFDVAESQNLRPGYFAVGIFASFLTFAEQNLDWMVIEVGLGGAIDASNVMHRPATTVITSIGLDHTDVLGGSLTEIAQKKAGILRPGVPIFIGDMPAEGRRAICDEAVRIGAPQIVANEDFYFDSANEVVIFNKSFPRSGPDKEPLNPIPFSLKSLPMRGDFQMKNGALAVAIAASLGLDEGAISEGLKRVRWPGRMEEFQFPLNREESVRIITDAAHNPDGMSEFCKFLKAELLKRGVSRLVVMASFLATKDWQRMSGQLTEFAAAMGKELEMPISFIATTSGNARALPPEELGKWLEESSGLSVEVQNNPTQALHIAAKLAKSDGLVAIVGSIYLLGAVRPDLTSKEFAIVD